ncbi:MAG: tape measure protein, partial [Anaerolineae bacterium]|nr:tape measure protein [Anaerolineae bacterium]
MRLSEAAAAQARKEYMLQRDSLDRLEAIYRESDKSAEGFALAQQKMQRELAETEKRMALLRAEAAKQARTIITSFQPRPGSPSPRPAPGPAPKPVPAQEVNSLRNLFNMLYGDSRKAMSLTQRWRGEVLSLVAAYGGLFGVAMLLGQVIEATQQMEAATARLNVALEGTGSTAEEELDFLRRTADRLGLSIGGLAQEYSKFAIATKGTNLEGQKTRDIFLSVAEAARVNRNSQAEVQGVFTALTQIVSKGAVQMEELRQQLGDRLPGALQIMADGLNVSTAELIKMMEQGQVTSDALVPFAEELRKRFGGGLNEALNSTSANLGRLQNAAFQALLAFGKAGFLEAFNELIKSTTELLHSAEFDSTLGRLSPLFALLADALRLVFENFQLVATFAGILIGIKITPFILAVYAAFMRVVTATAAVITGLNGTAAAATRAGAATAGAAAGFRGLAVALRALLSATGVGLAITVITGALAYWATSATDASVAMEQHRIIVDAVKNAYEAAGGAVDGWAKKIEGVTRAQAQTALLGATQELDRIRREATDALVPASGTEESRRRIATLIEMFRAGGLSAEAYKRAIQDIADQDDSLTTGTVAALQDMADETKDAEKRVDELRAVMVLLDEDSTEAAKNAALVMLGLK